MNTVTVILSDGEPFTVRRLGIFELDEQRPTPLGPFVYNIMILGKSYDAVYDIHAWENPPVKPEIPEHNIIPDSPEWHALNDWKLYQAGLLHEAKREAQINEFCNSVPKYILTHCCLSDINRIVTDLDWMKVYEAVLVPQLTVEVLADTLKETYQAQFEGVDVLTALNNISSDSGGSYDTLRVWENDLMVKMRLTEIEYSMLPLKERARKVCALFLPDIMSNLELERRRKLDEVKERGKSGRKV